MKYLEGITVGVQIHVITFQLFYLSIVQQYYVFKFTFQNFDSQIFKKEAITLNQNRIMGFKFTTFMIEFVLTLLCYGDLFVDFCASIKNVF